MRTLVVTTLLLIGSNVFMTLAWYGHLRFLEHKPLVVAIFAAWSVALFEYSLQVPANRIGITKLSVPQLRVLQEVVSLAVFVPVAAALFDLRFRWDFLWAALCLVGAVFFVFRGGFSGGGPG